MNNRICILIVSVVALCALTGLVLAQQSKVSQPQVQPGQERAQPGKDQAKLGQGGMARRIEIATYDPRTKRVKDFRTAVLRNKFEDGANITKTGVEQVGDKFYLVRASVGPNSCRTSWTALNDDGNGSLSLSGMLVVTDTCEGVNCAWCKLLKTGGPCNCKALTGTCNHKHTETMDPSKIAIIPNTTSTK
jgi:hypothetical protein